MRDPVTVATAPKPLYKPVARPIIDILHDLAQPIPERLLETRIHDGVTLTSIPWHRVVKLLDQYAPGWSGSVVSVQTVGDRVVLVYRFMLLVQEGTFSREATGSEFLTGGRGGECISSAESMAFRPAAATFGLGLYLYEKD